MEDLENGLNEQGLINFVKTVLLSGTNPRGKEAVENLSLSESGSNIRLLKSCLKNASNAQLLRYKPIQNDRILTCMLCF